MPSGLPAWQSACLVSRCPSKQTGFMLPFGGLGYLAYLQSASASPITKLSVNNALCRDRICAASNPVLAPPALPITRVATGIPRSIFTMQYRLLIPLNAVLYINTLSTGTKVFTANMLSKCAVPPASAIITLNPLAVLVQRS